MNVAFYDNKIYTIVPGPYWEQALENATVLGGNLVALSSPDEEAFVIDFVESIDSTRTWWWMGSVYDEAKGEMIWLNGEDNSYQKGYSDNDLTNLTYPDVALAEGLYQYSEFTADPGRNWEGANAENGLWAIGRNISLREGVAEIPYIQYEDSAYVVVQGETWQQARENAQKLGGDLTILNSQEEFELLVEQFSGYYSENVEGWQDGPYQALWIGITDEAKEGDWINVDGTKAGYFYDGENPYSRMAEDPEFYLPWYRTEPNNFQIENYGSISWSKYFTEVEGVEYPAGLNDMQTDFPIRNSDKPVFGIAEIKLPSEPEPDPITGTFDGPGTVNLNNKGVTPFTLFGSDELNVEAIKVDSLVFGGENSGIGVAQKKNGSFFASYEDVNGDEFLDLVVKVERSAFAGVAPTEPEPFEVFGSLTDGTTQVVFGLNEGDSINFIA